MMLSAPPADSRDRKGHTLTELLIAMVLGVTFSAGMVTVYLGAKQSALYQDQLARMQENGRLALVVLSREVVMSGFFATLWPPQTMTPRSAIANCGEQPWVLDMSIPLAHVDNYENGSSPLAPGVGALSCLQGEQIKNGTDILVVQRTAAEASLFMGTEAQRLGSSRVKSWYLVVREGAPVSWEQHAPADMGDLAARSPDVSYWKGLSRILYVRRFSNPHDKQDNLPTLCLESIAGNKMKSRCLVEGIEDLQFEFGIDSTGDDVPDRYLVAPSGGQIGRVVTVRVYLLVRSIAPLAGWVDDKNYSLGQKFVAARKDAYLRRVLSTTVLRHNRVAPELRQGGG